MSDTRASKRLPSSLVGGRALEAQLSQDTFLVLGYVLRPHALRGEIVIHPHHLESPIWKNSPELAFLEGKVAEGQDTITAVPKALLKLAAVRPSSDQRLICRFATLSEREGAEALIGTQVGLRLSELPPAEDDAIYHHELRGFRVVDATGRLYGEVLGIFTGPAQDLIEIRVPGEEDTYFIPFVSQIVTDIDRDTRELRIDPPEGLLP